MESCCVLWLSADTCPHPMKRNPKPQFPGFGCLTASRFLCRRGKSPQDKISQTFNGHHGPVYSVMRNTFFAKFFLTVGDWTARVWCDEIKTPMFMTFYHKAYLTSGSWHPVRPGVFLTTRMDGRLDVWDLMYKQTAAVLSVQVSNYALHTHKYVQTLASPLCLCAPALRHVCLFRVHMEWARDKVRCAQTRSPDAEPAMLLFLLRIQQDGRVVAAGGVDGITSLLELSPNLGELAKDEKSLIGLMFEREATRDKNLIQRARCLACQTWVFARAPFLAADAIHGCFGGHVLAQYSFGTCVCCPQVCGIVVVTQLFWDKSPQNTALWAHIFPAVQPFFCHTGLLIPAKTKKSAHSQPSHPP